MSLKLLKQSLDVIDQAESDKKDTQSKSKSFLKDGRFSRFGKNESKGHAKVSVKSTNVGKKNMDDIRKELLPDRNKTDLNLKRLLALSQNTINSVDAKKILKRSKKRTTVKVQKDSKELKSIFTEEDFLAFEKEYFASNS